MAPNRTHATCADCGKHVHPWQQRQTKRTPPSGSVASVKGENRNVVLCLGCVDVRMEELHASGREF